MILDGSWGVLDEFANPRQGYVLRPRVSVTLPGFNTSEYLLLDMGATGFMPLTDRIGFTVRGSAGRIFPFGRSVALSGRESPFVSLLRLRDVTFSLGGSRDVRGWGSQLLGPKLPEVRFRDEDGVTTAFAERYSPIGGLARIQTSAEVQLPLPGFDAKWQSFVFLDGGRVWTPDDRFSLDAGEFDQDRFFWGTGLGIGYETVVGAVQVALGYKLNPSRAGPARPRRGPPGARGRPADQHRRYRFEASPPASLLDRSHVLGGGLAADERRGTQKHPTAATCQTHRQVATLPLILPLSGPSAALPPGARSPSLPSACVLAVHPISGADPGARLRAYPLHITARFPRSFRVHRRQSATPSE